jgi:hypothetical protein
MRKEAKFTAITGERVCRVDLDDGEIHAEGIERDKCKKLLRSLLED